MDVPNDSARYPAPGGMNAGATRANRKSAERILLAEGTSFSQECGRTGRAGIRASGCANSPPLLDFNLFLGVPPKVPARAVPEVGKQGLDTNLVFWRRELIFRFAVLLVNHVFRLNRHVAEGLVVG
jgi:hypothetical protein